MVNDPTPAPDLSQGGFLKLKRPIEFGGETIRELRWKEFEASWMDDFPVGVGVVSSMGDFLKVAARACNVHPKAIGKLGRDDLFALVELLGPFLDPGADSTGDAR